MANLQITAEKTGLQGTASTRRGTATATADRVALAEITDSQGGDLLNAIEKGGILTVASSTLVPSDTTAWVHWRTDLNAAELKLRTGSEGSYSYAVSRRLFSGAARSMAYYHTADDPPSLTLSWNSNNDDPNVTGGGWTLDPANAKWVHFAFMQRDAANTVYVVPRIRMGDPSGSDIAVTVSGDGNLPTSINEVQELVDWLHGTAQFGGGTASTPQDTLVQVVKYEAPTRNPPTIQARESFFEQNFTIDADLRDYQSTFDEPIFCEGIIDINVEGTNDAGNISIQLAILDSGGNALTNPVETTLTFAVPGTTRATHHRIRVTGLMPLNYLGGRWRATVTANAMDSPKVAWVTEARFEFYPDRKADETTIDSGDYDNNLLPDLGLRNVKEALNQVDELPIQFADYEGVSWPTGANGIDIGSTTLSDRQRTVPIHQKIQDINARPGHTFIGKVSFDVNYIENSRTDNGPSVQYVHHITSDAQASPTLASRLATQGTTATNVSFEITIPSGTTVLTLDFAEPQDQSSMAIDQDDGRLNVANYRIDFQEGIDASGFDGNLTDSVISLQSLGQAVDDLSISGPGGGGESEWEIIWEAGPNFSDRLTTTSGTILRNLKTGKRFDQFRTFILQIDTNATSGVGLFVPAPEPAIQSMISGTWTGNEGTWIQIKYGFYKLMRPNNQTSFYILGGSEIGYRKLWAR